MSRYVEITFDCLPLRTIGRLDIPLDASPAFQEKYRRVKAAMEQHGCHNTYYLHNARCVYHLTNDEKVGVLDFSFEGTVLTDQADRSARQADLSVELAKETCDWLVESVVQWWHETVRVAVLAEFDRYIAAGDLQKAVERLEKIESQADEAGGYLGMYL